MKHRRDTGHGLYARWFDIIDKGLRKAVWILIVLLILVQGAMQSPVIRSWLSQADRLEGVPFEEVPGG